ncbi:MAG: hypothetical protein AAFP19_14590 [Bacteroidota bacterium]
MDLQVLVSKKGTQVVTATNLHKALKLPAHRYNSNIEKWLSDVYAFRDDIRKPSEFKDYALRQLQFAKQRDYYLSIELAKLITLNSDSEVKLKYAKHLMSLEAKEDSPETLSKDQVIAVLELTKVMGLISCQKSVEKEHQRFFEDAKGSVYQWWQYRAKLLGYSVDELKSKMLEIGRNYKGKNIVQMLFQLDKYEIIRMAVIDLFIALGRSRNYATTLGDLAKVFASEMKIEIWDDRNASIDLMCNNIKPELVQEVKTLRRDGFLARL